MDDLPEKIVPAAYLDRDNVVVWPSIAAVSALLLAGFFGSYSGFLVLPVGGAAVMGAIVALVMGCMSARGRNWRKTASFLILPIVVVATVVAPRKIVPPFARFGDYLRLLANQKSFEAEIEKLPQPAGSRYRVFDWAGFAGYNTLIIYDETDEIAEVDPKRAATQSKPLKPLMHECADRVVRIRGHYYRCDLPS